VVRADKLVRRSVSGEMPTLKVVGLRWVIVRHVPMIDNVSEIG